MSHACRNCGAILDAPRSNPATRRFARKCSQCLSWQDLSAEDVLVERLRARARTRWRRAV
jgi:hypothetical protein